MESSELITNGPLSPQPKRISIVARIEIFDLFRSRSCEVPDQILVSELNEILGQNSQWPERSSSPLFSKFSKAPPIRDKTNPITSDEKFILLENSLSTSEESGSGSDSDRFLPNF